MIDSKELAVRFAIIKVLVVDDEHYYAQGCAHAAHEYRHPHGL